LFASHGTSCFAATGSGTLTSYTAPLRLVPVEVGELRRGGQTTFASFVPAETGSAYLKLPSAHTALLAPGFVASEFGDFQLHACFLSTTLVMPGGYHPRPSELPS